MARVISYNEHKVKTDQADRLEASGFLKHPSLLGFTELLRRFEKLTELNQRTKVNSLHISLNFDPSEQLSEDKLLAIARDYLEQIGFGEQPFLVYRHRDAGHPHLHLVTTNIRPDGSAITLHKLGVNKSEPARLAMEEKYGLVPAESKQRRAVLKPEVVDAARVLYGKSETKKAIGRVLSFVLKEYKFASLPELNAVLGLYNVVADPGAVDSRVRRHEGLVFRVLDAEGNKVGTAVKASLFAGKPVLKDLRAMFEWNKVKPVEGQRHLRTVIDLALSGRELELDALKAVLKKEGIDLVLRQNEAGLVYGITYVDHVHRVVMNGSELGKNYSAKAMLERCKGLVASEGEKQSGEAQRPGGGAWRVGEPGRGHGGYVGAGEGKKEPAAGLVEVLLDTGYQPEAMDWELRRRKRKKKRRLSPG
ncbi:hypothetical protein FHW88_005018 [Mucilaginibacter sp. SG538B]|uniref:relaxase/mobilization nuclease domain-containing protein n=1 Tax=Mucilaginibacter sp. SG538B TaxID=2587021 RepID=UPI00159D0701|nr:relaxase/mobilization nuclease domain-containing protein [Mucilaginibacter sp. SG538B]NVM66700.1 hypothetical protein [Mucilaginibacter sp. SG538B]